jgi:hypothetical protein
VLLTQSGTTTQHTPGAVVEREEDAMRWRRHRTIATVEPPRWSTPSTRRRVLLEHADVDVREPLAHALTERGYDVVTCPGPHGGRTCPVLHDRPCYALDDADAVVTGLALTPSGRAIAMQALHDAERPLVVEGTPTMLAEADPALAAAAIYPLTAETVDDRLRRLFRDHVATEAGD